MASCSIAGLPAALWLATLIITQNLEVSLGEHAVDCCLKVSHTPIPKAIVVSYHEQVKGDGCSIDATVFQTKKGRNLCAPPQNEWAKQLKDFVDARQKKCLKNKGKRCQDMKSKSA